MSTSQTHEPQHQHEHHEHQKQSFWATVKQALKGGQQDYTQGSISKAVVLLAIPMILELSLESIFAVVDIFFVGRLGENAIATVGLTESVVTIIYSVSIGISIAASAVVARRIGEKNIDGAAHAGAQAIMIALVVAVILSALGIIFAGNILSFMGASPEVISEGINFTRIMLGSSVVIIFLFLINGIFRGAGDAAMAMKSLWLASILNIILCPIFIHFFGLPGAAIATLIGRSSGVAYQCYHLFTGKGLIKFKKHHFKFDNVVVKSILRIARPATLQFIIGSGSWIILTRLIAETGGTTASAGYQLAFRNFVFFMLPAWGLSNAAATLVGQNLGAKHYDRAEKSVMLTAKYNAIFMAVVTFIFLLFARPIIQIFTQDEAVIQFGSLALQMIGSAYIFYGIGMVFTQALNGAGDTRTPTLINFVCFWLFQIPLAYLLALTFNFGTMGALIAIPIAQTAVSLVSWAVFKRGKWKEIKV